MSCFAFTNFSSSLISSGSRFHANLVDVAIILPRWPFWSGAGKFPLLLARVFGPVCSPCSCSVRSEDLDRHANWRLFRSAICSTDGKFSFLRISVMEMSYDLRGSFTTVLMAWLQASWMLWVWVVLRRGRYAPPLEHSANHARFKYYSTVVE